jgi:hypothetical protein
LQNFLCRNFVARRYLAATREILTGNLLTNSDIDSRNNNIVIWMQANNGAS